MKEEELISRLKEIRKKIINGEYPMLNIDALIRQIQVGGYEIGSDDIEEEITNEVNRYTKYCEKRLSEMADDDTDISFMDLRSYAHHFANWQKQKMMKGALDGIVQTDNLVSLIEFNRIEFAKLLTKYNNGDRVKLIIIKKD